MSNPKEVLLKEISSGIIPIPIGKSAIGKVLSYPMILVHVKDPKFPAMKIGRRWYTTPGAISAWIADTNGFGTPEDRPEDSGDAEVQNGTESLEPVREDPDDDSPIL